MKGLNYILLASVLGGVVACGPKSAREAEASSASADSIEVKATYRNPVIRISAPDPTAIRLADGTYYLYRRDPSGLRG